MFTPALRQKFIQNLSQLIRMRGNLIISYTGFGNTGKSGLQFGQELRTKLRFNLLLLIILLHISCQVFVEKNGIHKTKSKLSMRTKSNLNIQVDILIQNTERNRISGTVFITDNFLRIEVINSLILCRIASKGKTLYEGFKAVYKILSQISVENTGLCRTVKYKLSGFRTNLHNCTLFHDNHALTVIYRNKSTIGNNIIRTLRIGTLRSDSLFPFQHQGVIIQCITIKVLSPLVAHHCT